MEYICKKDKEAYSQVVERYEKKLLRYASFLIKNETTAAEVVQDSFIKAYINLKSFDTKKKFSSWIYRIVHNEAINKIKRKKRLISIESVGVHKSLSIEDDNIEKLNKKEIKKLIQEGLDKLDAKYSEVLILYFLEDKSYEEISDILRLPIGTVGTRVARGKKILGKIVLKLEPSVV